MVLVIMYAWKGSSPETNYSGTSCCDCALHPLPCDSTPLLASNGKKAAPFPVSFCDLLEAILDAEQVRQSFVELIAALRSPQISCWSRGRFVDQLVEL